MTIATPVAFGRLHVLPIANEFLGAHPNIDLRMILSDRISHLLDDHIDVAVRLGELPDSSLVASRVGEIRRVVCASPDYFAMLGRPLTPSDLTAHDCVTFDQLMSAEAWSFLDGKSEMAVAIHSRLVVNTADAAIDAAIAGVGITRVLSYQAASGLRDGTLVLPLESFEPAP
jgi:DNA-binding transcriptional LysR family regulator